ncbi:hypothetical protein OF83DRAFT_341902 [Amylostereum chailletii]|nr:hypothetical protein OF83DRAFT_341902 [Amylostereum chailletii]
MGIHVLCFSAFALFSALAYCSSYTPSSYTQDSLQSLVLMPVTISFHDIHTRGICILLPSLPCTHTHISLHHSCPFNPHTTSSRCDCPKLATEPETREIRTLCAASLCIALSTSPRQLLRDDGRSQRGRFQAPLSMTDRLRTVCRPLLQVSGLPFQLSRIITYLFVSFKPSRSSYYRLQSKSATLTSTQRERT